MSAAEHIALRRLQTTGQSIEKSSNRVARLSDMPLSQVTRSFVQRSGGRLHQGDIFRDLLIEKWKRAGADSSDILVSDCVLPYCVLVTQDCDLEHDWRNRSDARAAKRDKYLRDLLLLPAYPAEQLRTGTHLREAFDESTWVMENYNSDRWSPIKTNQNERYHYIVGNADFQLPDLAVDFKHYTSVPREQLYELAVTRYRATISALFREDLSHRFASYLSRVALPELSVAPAT